MNRAFLFIIAFLFSLTKVFSQAQPSVIIPPFEDDYCHTVKQLEEGGTNIDYRKFRESFIESEQFIIASRQTTVFDSLKKEMYKYMKKSNYDHVIKITKQMLSIDYTSMIAHKILQQTYKIKGDTLNWKKYHTIEFGLLKSIVNNGDGKSCSTAWPVVQISEEYFILEMLGADVKKQSIERKGGFCDKMTVKMKGRKKTFYFEISKVFEGYDKRTKSK